MRLLDLFSGIGGFSLAAQWVWRDELEIVAFVEIDPFCQKVLRKHWPEVPIIGDVRDVTSKQIVAYCNNQRSQRRNGPILQECSSQQSFGSCNSSIDLLTGGFPCQPFSVAGKRRGKEDDRFLWPEMLRVIQEIRPRWVVAENVTGINRLVLDDCLTDLETEGYWNYTDKKGNRKIAPLVVPACAVNAPHRRDRVWIVAHNGCFGNEFKRIDRICNKKKEEMQGEMGQQWIRSKIGDGGQDVADLSEQRLEGQRKTSWSKSAGFGQSSWWSTQPRLGRIIDGLPFGLDGHLWTDGWEDGVPRVAKEMPDRVNRLKALGNAIVWLVVVPIFRAIKEIEGKGI